MFEPRRRRNGIIKGRSQFQSALCSLDFISYILQVIYRSAHRSLSFSRKADPYSRLRVPIYQKVFEALFFVTFLALYYAVLVQRNPRKITPIEVCLYIWIAAFAYEELGEFTDAGTLFYAQDFWGFWDLSIIGVGAGFFISSKYFSLPMRDTPHPPTDADAEYARRNHRSCQGQ